MIQTGHLSLKRIYRTHFAPYVGFTEEKKPEEKVDDDEASTESSESKAETKPSS